MSKHLTTTRVAALVVATMIAAQYFRGDGGGADGDYSAVERAAHEAIIRFAAENAAMCEAMADAIRREEIDSDVDMVAWFDENRDEARKRAFHDLNVITERDMPRRDGKLDPREAADFYEAKARGYRSVK